MVRLFAKAHTRTSLDWRLDAIYLTLCVLAVSGMFVQLLGQHKWAEFSPAFSSTEMFFSSSGRSINDTFLADPTISKDIQCDNASYDYAMAAHEIDEFGDHRTRKSPCKWWDDLQIMYISNNQIGAATSFWTVSPIRQVRNHSFAIDVERLRH